MLLSLLGINHVERNGESSTVALSRSVMLLLPTPPQDEKNCKKKMSKDCNSFGFEHDKPFKRSLYLYKF